MRGILIILTILGIISCSYEEPVTPPVEETTEAAVQLELVGSQIEGLTVCFDANNTCKKTSTTGVVDYTYFGEYRFMIRDMNITTLSIDANRTVISPYELFESNETLAQRFLVLIHAFSKSTDPTDDSVLLTLSKFIPENTNISALLANNILTYSIDDNNVSINFSDNNISRNGTDFNQRVPSKAAYTSLGIVKNFVDFAKDKNVSLDNFEEKHLLSKTSLTTFTLGSKYTVTIKVEGEKVFLNFLDNETRVTDKATLIDNNNTEVLSTNLLSLRVNTSN